jgi:hypothetical protein
MNKVIEALESSIEICSRTGLIADEKVTREALTQARLDEDFMEKYREWFEYSTRTYPSYWLKYKQQETEKVYMNNAIEAWQAREQG